ncbi:MAG TPA: hypothetical protein DD490_15655 [Acidobacteria bacterium]|nr:hypothetical protein [Acidobacteriota bacterium]
MPWLRRETWRGSISPFSYRQRCRSAPRPGMG